MSAPASQVETAPSEFPPIRIRTWHDRYPKDADDRFDETGNEYWFVEARTADDERVVDATGWMKEATARRIQCVWNCHDELLEAVRELLATHPAAYRDPNAIDNRTDNAVRIARAAVAKVKGLS